MSEYSMEENFEKRTRTKRKFHRRLMRFGDQQEGAVNLPTWMFQQTLEELYLRGKFVFYIGDFNYLLNERTYPILKSMMNADGTIREGNVWENGSDEEFFETLSLVPFFSVEKWIPHGANTIGGRFFNFTHEVEGLDLQDFQIFTRETFESNLASINGENCFLCALRVAGVDISQIRRLCKSRELPRYLITDIANKFGLYITVKTVNTKNLSHFGTKTDTPIELGLLDNHYFLIKKVPITSFAIKNYYELKHLPNWSDIVGYKKDGRPKRADRHLNSFQVIELLINWFCIPFEPLLTPIPRELLIKTIYEDKNQSITNITIHEDDLKLNEIKEKTESEITYQQIFFDFETLTDGIHVPYLCRVWWKGTGHRRVFYGEDCGKDMLNFLCKKFSGKGLMLLAHNCGYDIRFIFEYLSNHSLIERGRSLLRGKARFFKNPIILQDSLAHIPMGLAKFADTFGMDVSKEIIPYKLYTKERVDRRFIPMEECLEFVDIEYRSKNIGKPITSQDLEQFRKEFIENVTKWDCGLENVDILKYSSMYCQMDCEVLGKGYLMFRDWIMEITKKRGRELDIDDYVSLPSVANEAMAECYEGVYKLSGCVREFIQQAMVGGKTMMAHNTKAVITGSICDFDAVSLYPSAMVELGGYLMGKPKELLEHQLKYEILKSFDGYFVDILIKKVGIQGRAFPLMSKHDDNGVRVWSDRGLEGDTITVDKTQLEDLIEFHHVEFEVVRGYYYNEGRNMKLQEIITYYFNERLKQKDLDNPIQNVYKLLMNSAYGKTLLKPFLTEKRYMREKQAIKYMDKNYNKVKGFTPLGEGNVMIEVFNIIEKHYNNASCGVEVLGMAKRIMNRVFCLAEDNGMEIMYQDTDSAHLHSKDIPELERLYRKKYKKELIGKDMGQFHSDFESKKLTGNKFQNKETGEIITKNFESLKLQKSWKKINKHLWESHGELVSKELIMLGKKSYMDSLVGLDYKGDQGEDTHVRMKGCNNESMLYYCKENGITIRDLYMKFYNDEKVVLDQTCGGQKICFDFTKDFRVRTKMEFPRMMSFISA